MSAFIVNVLYAFFPVSLLAGTFLFLERNAGNTKFTKKLFWSLFIGFVTGCGLYKVALSYKLGIELKTILESTSLIGLLSTLTLSLFVSEKSNRFLHLLRTLSSLFFLFSFTTQGTFSLVRFISVEGFTATSVLNTDIILHFGSILFSLILVFALIFITKNLGKGSGKTVTLVFLSILSILFILRGISEILLGLMRMEAMEATSLALSFVAKVSNIIPLFQYFYLAIFTGLFLVFFIKRPKIKENTSIPKTEHRKNLRIIRQELRWFKFALVSMVLIFSSLLYHDLYASRPPTLSKATNLKPNKNGVIRIKIDHVKDRKLHRFSYISYEGHVVRYFLINTSKDQVKMGVVFDACLLCGGEQGYVQQGNEVLCLSCNVKVYIPSIGKRGGCNPIPIIHEIKNGYVVLTRANLEKGANLFPETITIKIKDPVTKSEVTNKSEYQYFYQKRIWYFESKKSLEKFRASPKSFVKQ